MKRIAVIDLGTNTFKLLVASKDAAGRLVVHVEEEVPVGLGKGGIEKGMITEDAFLRCLDALGSFEEKAAQNGASQILGYGTSALRNARNGAEFVRKAWELHGIGITIIPGEEEAGLILDGVRQAVRFGPKPMLVMDIGGGSIEFILATDKALMWKRSFELGTTRLCERFGISEIPNTSDEFRSAAHLDAQLEPLWAVMERHWPAVLVGSAGAFDTLAAMLSASRGLSLHGVNTIPFTDTEFQAVKEDLFAMTRTQRRGVKGLPSHRVDTILPALSTIERVLLHGPTELRWSRFALKEGAAWRTLDRLIP